MEKISVLIVEDDQDFREGLQWLLSTDPRLEIVGALTNANDIDMHISHLRPQVVLLDQHLGDDNPTGLDALPVILATQPDTQVIMLTSFDYNQLIFKSIHLGANGYILKVNVGTELIANIMTVMSGGSPMTGYIARRALDLMREAERIQQKLAAGAHPVLSPQYHDHADRLGLLTPRQTEVLECLVEGKSYKLVADHLGMSEKTVSNHLREVYRKLQVNSMSEAVAMAVRVWVATGKM